jgi:hypothetical protein
MRPAQKVRQRRTLSGSEVKLPNADHIAATEPLAMTQREVPGKPCQKSRAIFGPAFTTLLEFDDIVSDLPVGFGDVSVDGLMSACLSGRVDVGDAA